MTLHKTESSKREFSMMEMIVILIILAVLAAILVPALLGYTDKAKEKQYTMDANAIYEAMTTEMTELYEQGMIDDQTEIKEIPGEGEIYANVLTDIETKSELDITSITDINWGKKAAQREQPMRAGAAGTTRMRIRFTASNGDLVEGMLENETWTFKK